MELVLVAVALLIGIALGLTVRRRGTDVERVRVQYVDKPTVVEKVIERVRVEYVDKPVIVEHERLKVERVEVPHIIEKTIVQRVDSPAIVRGSAPGSAAGGVVSVVYMDANERRVKAEGYLDAKLRRPTIMRDGVKFVCVRQDAEGRFVYRQVAH